MREVFSQDDSRKCAVLDCETIIAVFRFETDASEFVANHGHDRCMYWNSLHRKNCDKRSKPRCKPRSIANAKLKNRNAK
jgi:hypothetical protein